MYLPTTRQLECLVAVAETLNFRKAAEACHITQPALSAQIQQLETMLGQKLFERDRRRVLPTDVGAALADKARRILGDMREFVEASAGYQVPLSGQVCLGVIPTVAPYILPRALKEVRRRYPKLRIRLREGQTAQLATHLENGSIDLALLALEADLGDLETMRLHRDPFVLAVPTDHRMATRKRVREEDLLDEEVLLLEDGHCLRAQALSICHRAGACELGDFRASSLTTLVQMVSGGLGLTLLPEIAVSVEAGRDRALKLIPFGAKGPARTIGLAWRPSSIRKSEFRLFGEAIQRGLSRS